MEKATPEDSEPHDVLQCDTTDSSPQNITLDFSTAPPTDSKIRDASCEISKERLKRRSEFNNSKRWEKSTRWGKYKISEGASSVADLEYDCSRGWPPVLITPVQKAEVESLQFKLGLMFVESLEERKKKVAEKIRKYRDGLKLKEKKVLGPKIFEKV